MTVECKKSDLDEIENRIRKGIVSAAIPLIESCRETVPADLSARLEALADAIPNNDVTACAAKMEQGLERARYLIDYANRQLEPEEWISVVGAISDAYGLLRFAKRRGIVIALEGFEQAVDSAAEICAQGSGNEVSRAIRRARRHDATPLPPRLDL